MKERFDLFGYPVKEEMMYWIDEEKQISASGLKKADRETQIDAMKIWFFARFEDPAENTPYVGSEGGYQFIHGGPFDAREQLDEEFEGVVPDDVIDELEKELTNISDEWAPILTEADYDDYLLDSISVFTARYDAFRGIISNTRLLAEVTVPYLQQQHLYRLLYVSAIIACETYLSDTFISAVSANKARLRKFVETDQNFGAEKVPLKCMFERMKKIEREVKEHLLAFLWHRLTDVQKMYLNTLNVTFPDDFSYLSQAIGIRHDIVHRGGKKKDDTEQLIGKGDILKVCSAAEDFIFHIERQFNPEAVKPTDGDDEGLQPY